MDIIRMLQGWYASQCDGDWEHQHGVQLETLDNPGWRLTVDLEGTPLEGEPFQAVRDERTERDWVRCEVKNGRFEARCGPTNLEEVLTTFLDWAARVDTTQRR